MPLSSSLTAKLKQQKPFSLLNEEEQSAWFSDASLAQTKTGGRILRPDQINSSIYLLLTGQIRLLAPGADNEGIITLSVRGPGQLFGWANLLRACPAEHVIASSESSMLAFSSKLFVDTYKSNKLFASYFNNLGNIQESYHVARDFYLNSPSRIDDITNVLISLSEKTRVHSLCQGTSESSLPALPKGWNWHLSTAVKGSHKSGDIITASDFSYLYSSSLSLPVRLICLPPINDKVLLPVRSEQDDRFSPKAELDFYNLGIYESDKLEDEEKYLVVMGRGPVKSTLAVCEIVSRMQNVPFRRDTIKKVIEAQLRRDKSVTLEFLGSLCELLGLTSQIGEVDFINIRSVESPAIFLLDEVPVVLQSIQKDIVILSHPKFGIMRKPLLELSESIGEKLRFVLPRRNNTSPSSRFGFAWFTPLLKKYKKPLVLVFIASLFAQLFALAIPLLLQQIIDKVLTQGNLSSLNVLAAAMILMALFQGILQCLRTFIFVDTTDRMDLTLGSAVIDRLLALPLTYFEKRPVGELSQRLGELNTIRGFLTGTALISVLNIVFAAIYLVVMFIYSPLLSVIALSTFPLYALLVFTVAPIYKSLIRQRAVAQAKTQSHLIEVIGGIQTVKAQHFELTARWKWQDRYRRFVSEGYKSVVLGSTSGEIGNFLNSVSSLLILWVGMTLILKGEFTLGQLIAFRIIAGNVTGPLLQLSGLYQGFQGVQLSMERLSDIVDQPSELKLETDHEQISLPTVSGDVKFENVRFRFKEDGPYQLDNVSVDIPSGSFVGIVGQSGSGKSTLMKLLPRLYSPSRGRISIDDFDISKVDLSSLRRQVGIVPQDSLLFEGSISQNIALNDTQASTEAIITAAKLACAHDFIMELSDGYATNIAERGSNLSGGQRQRIAIARTILTNPQLLVMDEATSALDYNTERNLCQNLQAWSANRTVFFITHRLATIMNADIILVMHQGRLVEQGQHTELLRMNGRYAAMYKQQEA